MAGLSPKLPIQRDVADGYSLTKTYTEMILQNLKGLILTLPGERIMDPAFGVGLKKYLFEQHSVITYSNIHARITNQVEKYMPFVGINDVVFYGPDGIWSSTNGYLPGIESPNLDPNRLQIKIFLTITPIGRGTTLELKV